MHFLVPWVLTSFNFSSRFVEDFEILHGDYQGLSDTMTFLKSLAELDVFHDSGAEKRQMRERKAAAGLFNWQVLLF